MDEIVSYLRRIPAWYLATIDVNDPTQPRVRPFSFAMADAGKLWFCTSRDKDVWFELEAHPKFELSGWKPGECWIVWWAIRLARCSGKRCAGDFLPAECSRRP